MPSFEINSFFTINDQPATTLGDFPYANYPRVRIWEIEGSVYNLVLGSPDGSGQNTDGVMTRMETVSSSDGFYTFLFTDLIGYDTTKNYLVRIDGGPGVDTQFQTGIITPEVAVSVGQEIWDTVVSNPVPDSAWDLLSKAKTNTDNILLNLTDTTELVNLCVKYNTNRTKVDLVNKTLTVYDNDCVTILRTFKLLNSHGQPSIHEIAERVPIYSSDDKPVC